MDRGGRLAESLTSGSAAGASAHRQARYGAEPAARSRGLVRFAPSLWLGLGRRSSVAVPLARRIPRLTGTGLVLGFFAAIGAYGLEASGRFVEFRAAYGDPRDIVARGLGFGLDKITISGLSHLTEADVLRVAGITPRSSLPFLGATDLRERLLAEPFVKTAEVRKYYPGELRVALVEREPFALWQLNGELVVIAADGTAIDKLRDASLAGLPLVVGEGANGRAASYVALLDAAGPLRSKIRAGMLVSGRRWTLKFENGLDVRFPEEGAVAAMTRLVRLDRETGLLGKDVLTVDLRMPDRVVVRLSEEAAAARAEMVGKKKLQRGVKGVDT